MPNACFRCKTPIQSGDTFCRDCSRKVDLSKLEWTGESRVWLGVLAFPAWLAVSVPLGVGARMALPRGPATLVTSLASMVTVVLAMTFLVALVMDASHLRERDDVEWNTSQWLYYGLAFVCFVGLFLPAPFVAAYHLYKRHGTAGLPT